jgi:hypothetical protein
MKQQLLAASVAPLEENPSDERMKLLTLSQLSAYRKFAEKSEDMALTQVDRTRNKTYAIRVLQRADEILQNKQTVSLMTPDERSEFEKERTVSPDEVAGLVDMMSKSQRMTYDNLVQSSKNTELTATQQCNLRFGSAAVLIRVKMTAASEAEKFSLLTEEEKIPLVPEELLDETQLTIYKQHLLDVDDPTLSTACQSIKRSLAREILKRAKAKRDENKKLSLMSVEERCVFLVDKSNTPQQLDKKAKSQKAGLALTATRQKQRDDGDPAGIIYYENKCRKAQEARDLENSKHIIEVTRWTHENGGFASQFGDGNGSREDDIASCVNTIMTSAAGCCSHCDPENLTRSKWERENGSKTIKERLLDGDIAAHFMITRTPVFPGDEENCVETQGFMVGIARDPVWRIDTQGDLKRFTLPQFRSVSSSYLIWTCSTADDITSIEGALQRYMDELHVPRGVSLHKIAGAGSRGGRVSIHEFKKIEQGERMTFSLCLTTVKISNCVYSIEDGDKRLLAANVISKNGADVFPVKTRGNEKYFPDFPSVAADRENARVNLTSQNERKRSRESGNVNDE